jgi:hypothetical protein
MVIPSLVSQRTGNYSIGPDGREPPDPSDRIRPSVHVRMLGPLTVSRDGVTLTLPASRKVRALLAYLALVFWSTNSLY